MKKYDVLTLGRSSIDLYSNDIGVPFVEIKSFNAYVGGSSTNIAVGCARLGLDTALLTAVAPDKVGDFILHFLNKEGVETKFIPTVSNTRSSAVLLGIEPPDRFPLVYYRDNAADVHIREEDVRRANIPDFRIIVPSGTALSREPSRSAIQYAVRDARKNNVQVILDLDFRADQWENVYDYQTTLVSVLPYVDIILATEEELLAAYDDKVDIRIRHQQISAPVVSGDLSKSIQNCFSQTIECLIMKRGGRGARIYTAPDNFENVPGFEVEVLNVLGAGDAFAAGFIYGLLKNWEMYKAVRLGNACGAIVVKSHGCANFCPNLKEAMEMANSQGGL